jgi:predicted DNA-binding transcriptional regulator AlpA
VNKLDKQQVCERLRLSARQLDNIIARNEFPRGVRQGKTHQWAESVVERFDQERFKDQLTFFDRLLG